MPQFVPPGPFTGASAGTAGSPGLVPAPIAGQQGRVLTGDGIWSALVDNVGAAPVQSVNTRTGAIVLDKTDVGLGNVDNTSDANKPVSTATAAAIAAHTTNTLNPHSVTKAQVGLGSVDNTADVDKPVSTAQAAADTAVANAAASALSTHTSNTSNPHSVTKAQVGLANVDNTSDANKPISTATQTALDLKANANDAVLTGAPVATTASAGNNSTRIATTAFVQTAVAGVGGGGGGTSNRFTVEQTAHGFSAEQVVYNNGTTWVLARADAVATSIGIGVIESVTTDDFVLVVGGTVTLTGKTANTQYYLSAATAGLLTATAPSNAAHFLVRVVKTNSTTDGLVEIGEPLSLGLLSNSDLAEMAANTVKANTTGSSAAPSDVAIATTFKTALSLAKADVGLGNVTNVEQLPISYLDTDDTLSADSDTKVPSQQAVKAYVTANSGAAPTGVAALWPTGAIGSPPSGWIAMNGSNGTTNESAVGGLSLIQKHGGTVATPTFSPAAGTFTSTQSVTISCATSGVVIKYTTNGSTPSRSVGTTYTGAISVSSSQTLKAIAYRTPDSPSALMIDSAVATAAYVIDAAPTLSGNPTINADGDELTIALNEAVSIGAGGNGGFVLDASGGAATLTYASGSGTSTLVYSISRPILDDETVTLDYAQPGNGVEDSAGNDLAGFTEQAVTNNSTQTGGSTPVLLSSVATGGTTNGVTSGSIDTTGANLLVVSVSWYAAGGADVQTGQLTDSKGNTWTQLNLAGTISTSISANRLFYCYGGTVGTGHTFTVSQSNSYPAIAVMAFSNVAASPLDQQSQGDAPATSTVQPGSITATQANALLITACTWDGGTASVGSSFTDLVSAAPSSGNNMGAAMACRVDTSAAATNPTWTKTGAVSWMAASIASFKF